MDIYLPEMSGIEATREIRRFERENDVFTLYICVRMCI